MYIPSFLYDKGYLMLNFRFKILENPMLVKATSGSLIMVN